MAAFDPQRVARSRTATVSARAQPDKQVFSIDDCERSTLYNARASHLIVADTQELESFWSFSSLACPNPDAKTMQT